MKTKLAYVLVSDESDKYLEQALISVYSARFRNPNAHITLVTDQDTLDTCKTGVRKQYVDSFDEVIGIDTSFYELKILRSRYLKTTLRHHISGDFLYIDCDTVICDSLKDIDLTDGPVAMVKDVHLPREAQLGFHGIANYHRMGLDQPTENYFNGGVIFAKDTREAHDLFDSWHNEWEETRKSGNPIDQLPLHRVLARNQHEIAELDGVWNCMIWGCFLPYLNGAKILHISPNSTARWICQLANPKILERIKEEDCLPEDFIDMIKSPKDFFNTAFALPNDEEAEFKRTDFVTWSYNLKKDSPKLFELLKKFQYLLLKINSFSYRN